MSRLRKGTKSAAPQDTALRKRAEKIARGKAVQYPENIEAMSAEETRETLHELRVHQIELEMQNEELRRGQAELDAARARYFDLYDLAPVGYCTISEQGVILEANCTAATLLGVPRGELVKQPISRFILKDDQDIYYLHHKQLFESGEPQASELRMVTKDGTTFWARLEAIPAQNDEGASPVGDSQGSPVCRVALSDITEHKRAEDALRHAHWRLESIIEGTHVGTWEWNVQTGETVFNEVWAQIIGYTLDELAPISIKTWETLAHPDDLKQSAELLERHFSGELPHYDCDCRIKHKDGHWVWVHDSGRVITCTGDGKPLMMFGTHTDITERKRAEERIGAALSEKEVLLKEIHHRVKNNLQIVSSLLFLQSARTKDPEAVSVLRESRNRVRSMALIHERLYQSPNLASVDMGKYVRNLVSDLHHSYRTEDGLVRFTLNLEDIALGITEAIPCGLIINELVSNALKHAFLKGKEGELRIQLVKDDAGHLTLTVSDNGIGFPERVNLRQSPSLGLTLINSLVEQLNGSIELDRRGGTTVTITFNVGG